MASLANESQIVLRRSLLVLVGALAYLTGCANGNGGRAMGTHMDHGKPAAIPKELASAHYYLEFSELDKFQPGRAKREILEDTEWRGDFDVAAEYKGNSVYVITYEVVADRDTSDRGEFVHAVFVADKFVKFIKWLPGDMEEVPYQGTTWRRPKPIKVGDISWLARATESDPVSIDVLRREVKAMPAAPSQVDPGLTIATLLLQPLFIPQYIAHAGDYKKNALLRDQFNAERLSIGMTEADVESVLRTQPFESGAVEAASYKIYGRDESFNIDSWLRFSNILIVFREGRARIIRALTSGGDNWRQELGKGFIDLPKPPAGPSSNPESEKGINQKNE